MYTSVVHRCGGMGLDTRGGMGLDTRVRSTPQALQSERGLAWEAEAGPRLFPFRTELPLEDLSAAVTSLPVRFRAI